MWGGNDLAGTAFREATGTPLQLRFSVFYLRGDSTGNDRLGLRDIKPLRRFAAIADPQHEQHEETLEWRGAFDAEAFDANKAMKEMRKLK